MRYTKELMLASFMAVAAPINASTLDTTRIIPADICKENTLLSADSIKSCSYEAFGALKVVMNDLDKKFTPKLVEKLMSTRTEEARRTQAFINSYNGLCHQEVPYKFLVAGLNETDLTDIFANMATCVEYVERIHEILQLKYDKAYLEQISSRFREIGFISELIPA